MGSQRVGHDYVTDLIWSDADDTTLKAESKKELLMKVTEESEEAGLKLNIEKTNITASGPIISWQIDEETMETVTLFLGL